MNDNLGAAKGGCNHFLLLVACLGGLLFVISIPMIALAHGYGPCEKRPQQVIGCEVWRNLDWLMDAEKVLMDVSGQDNLAAALNGIFDSQIAGGKRYDLATLGRRKANATFFESHATDKATQLIFGMDLTPLVADESRDIVEYVCCHIEKFKTDVRKKLDKRLGRA
jgi:hypothetical protein